MNQFQFRALSIGDETIVKQLLSQLIGKEVESVDIHPLIADPKCHCVVLLENENVVGFGSLVRYTVPSKGEVARIEDVVVEEKHRGKGYGKAIVIELLQIAKMEEIKIVDLSSSKFRTSAHKLYESLGFKKRESDLYRLEL